MIYYIVIATLFFCGYFYRKDRRWYYFCMIVLFVFTAFRDISLGGTDAYFYQIFFRNVPDIFHLIGYQSPYGMGYTIFNSIIKTFTDNYLVYQVIYTLVVLILLDAIIKNLKLKYNEECLFMFVYFCYRFIWSNFVTLRQNIANLVIWWIVLSICEYKEKKVLKGGVGVTISLLFHATSFLNYLLVPVLEIIKKISIQIRMLGTCLISFILIVFSGSFIRSILSLFIKYAGSRYSVYLEDLGGDDINFVNYIIRITLVIAVGVLYEKIKYEKKEIIYNSLMMSSLLGSVRMALATRFYEYYAVGIYGAFVILARSLKKRTRMIYLFLLYVAMLIILIRFLIITDDGLYLNYRFN